MKIAVSSDAHDPLVDFVLEEAHKRGHETVYYGPRSSESEADWPEVTRQAAEDVAAGRADEGIVICWTGTGASIAANKVAGIRAALCGDAETARGARVWNHANVLALSMRATPLPIAGEILERWFDTPFSDDDWNKTQIERIAMLDSTRTD